MRDADRRRTVRRDLREPGRRARLHARRRSQRRVACRRLWERAASARVPDRRRAASTPQQSAMAAVLWAGDGALVSHATAAVLWEFEGVRASEGRALGADASEASRSERSTIHRGEATRPADRTDARRRSRSRRRSARSSTCRRGSRTHRLLAGARRTCIRRELVDPERLAARLDALRTRAVPAAADSRQLLGARGGGTATRVGTRDARLAARSVERTCRSRSASTGSSLAGRALSPRLRLARHKVGAGVRRLRVPRRPPACVERPGAAAPSSRRRAGGCCRSPGSAVHDEPERVDSMAARRARARRLRFIGACDSAERESSRQ